MTDVFMLEESHVFSSSLSYLFSVVVI